MRQGERGKSRCECDDATDALLGVPGEQLCQPEVPYSPFPFPSLLSPPACLVPFQLALACILLERAIRADRLSDGWHLWHHESEALACTTVAAVAVRVMALDDAIDYCREGLGKQAQGR